MKQINQKERIVFKKKGPFERKRVCLEKEGFN